MNYFLIVLVTFCATLAACRQKSINCGLECGTQNEALIFQTGFTQTTLTTGEYKNATFAGFDTNFLSNNDWETFNEHPKIGFVEIGYEDGDNSQRLASIVDDPDHSGNEVLKFQLMEASIKEGAKRKGRVQLSIHDNQCINELYQTIKLKLHPDLTHLKTKAGELSWFTLFEFWNNGAWTGEKNKFRVTVNLFKGEGAGNPIYFRVKSDRKTCKTCSWKEVWGENATHFPLVFGEWLEIEMYLKEGDENNGRFYMAVTPEGGSQVVLFDINHTTQHPKEKCPDGFTHFEAMKVYTSEENIDYMTSAGKELSLYWDDWSFYVNKQP